MNLKTVIVAVILALFSLKAFTSEQDLYDFLWLDPDKKVYVLQNKVYEKDGTFYVSGGLGKGLSTDFQDTRVMSLRAGWYFSEEWGIELIYSSKDHDNDDAYKSITNSGANNKIPFVRRINSYYGGLVTWSPFYGKINTFNRIFYFDWSFGLGVSSIDAESNRTAFQQNATVDAYEAESFTGALWKTQLRFYITENLNADLDLTGNLYKANSGISDSKEIRNNMDASISIGVSF